MKIQRLPNLALVAWLLVSVASGCGKSASQAPDTSGFDSDGSSDADSSGFSGSGSTVDLLRTGGANAGGAAGQCTGADCPGAAGSGAAALCGNAVLDSGESCDDGNSMPGDGSSSR